MNKVLVVKRLLATAAVVAVWMAVGGSPLRADMITNGSFEVPTVPVGGFTNFTNGSGAITGWTVVGPQVSVVSNSYVSECCTFPAEDGLQWLDLTGDGSNRDTEGVEQTVATMQGTQYTLSFWVGNVYDPRGIYGTTSTADVYINGTEVMAATNSNMTTGTQTWEQFNYMFTADGSSTTIEFLNGDPSNDNTNGLDNVTLNATGAAPEPSSLLLFGAGLCGLGITFKRKAGAN
jgi:Protein of unknown function (DUF642)/PEP-CTERM motif